jgi:hypothetical protein
VDPERHDPDAGAPHLSASRSFELTAGPAAIAVIALVVAVVALVLVVVVAVT